MRHLTSSSSKFVSNVSVREDRCLFLSVLYSKSIHSDPETSRNSYFNKHDSESESEIEDESEDDPDDLELTDDEEKV